MSKLEIIIIYLVIINLMVFFSMAWDKYKARQGKWRTPERTLFILAFLGGSIGSIAGMHVFRHKTRHKTFTLGMPAILVIQLAVCIFTLYFFNQ